VSIYKKLLNSGTGDMQCLSKDTDASEAARRITQQKRLFPKRT